MHSPGSELSFGIIGCGRVVQELHLPAWQLIPEARLVAICDGNRAALQAVSAQRAGVRHYTTVEPFLADAHDLDFVVLATPGFSHPTIGEQVLRQKLHLLCEKPLALCIGDAEHLFNVAAQEGVILTPIHNYRYRHTVLAGRARAAQGVLGDIVSVSVRFRSGSLFDEPVKWMRQEQRHRTLLFDFAYHYIDLALLFLGPVSSLRFVEAETDSLGLQSVVFGTLHQHGARGFFELMLDASCCRTEIEVLGESCGLTLDFFPDGFRMLPRRDTPLHRGIADARQCFQFALHRVKQRLPRSISYRVLPHARVFRAFVNALRQGGVTPVPRAEVQQTISLLSEVAERAY
jgi:predicted dehydrogenase